MTRKLTNFTFFKNTPLVDFQNTILFQNNQTRDNHFLSGGHYPTMYISSIDFNFIRDRSTLRLKDIPYDEWQGVNYCTLIRDFEPNTRYYAYVIQVRYVNERVIEVDLLIDGVMTFMQGNVLHTLRNLEIERQHLPYNEYNNRLWELKNNGDILNTSTKTYFEQKELYFEGLGILIQSSADLRGNFGTENDPKIKTSKGMTFDKISSPLELYLVEQEHFHEFMDKLSDFPWIAQNIQSLMLVPLELLDGAYTHISVADDFGFNHLYVLRNNGRSQNTALDERLVNEVNLSTSNLYALFDLDERNEKHLLRSEYTTTEIYTNNGQQLLIDNGLLNTYRGFTLKVSQVLGFKNEVRFYVNGYQKEGELIGNNQMQGAFLNNSISFDTFDDVPILVDNYKLALANNANQRQLAEDKLITNRVENVFDSSADIKDRFFNASSILTNINPTNLLGKFTDEYEFYRTQKAEFADLALATPTVTNQSHGNSLQIANDFFGLQVKFSKPSESELKKIKKYYKSFGFETLDTNATLSNIRSQTIANFVKFRGSWTLPYVDVNLIEQMKAQFENGIRFWHDNGTGNPMTQDLIHNDMR